MVTRVHVIVFQHELESQLADLQNKSQERAQKLGSSKDLYQYLREAGELQDWINDQIQVASSEEYGEDYEHVQVSVGER